jgi:hypothetical protein
VGTQDRPLRGQVDDRYRDEFESNVEGRNEDAERGNVATLKAGTRTQSVRGDVPTQSVGTRQDQPLRGRVDDVRQVGNLPHDDAERGNEETNDN